VHRYLITVISDATISDHQACVAASLLLTYIPPSFVADLLAQRVRLVPTPPTGEEENVWF
jgi:hypothetical protein